MEALPYGGGGGVRIVNTLSVIRRKGRQGRRPLRAGAKPAPSGVRQRMRLSHASQMVRGLCPRDMIRLAVGGGVRTVGDVGKNGHA